MHAHDEGPESAAAHPVGFVAIAGPPGDLEHVGALIIRITPDPALQLWPVAMRIELH